jgi:hypothetical protein
MSSQRFVAIAIAQLPDVHDDDASRLPSSGEIAGEHSLSSDSW